MLPEQFQPALKHEFHFSTHFGQHRCPRTVHDEREDFRSPWLQLGAFGFAGDLLRGFEHRFGKLQHAAISGGLRREQVPAIQPHKQ